MAKRVRNATSTDVARVAPGKRMVAVVLTGAQWVALLARATAMPADAYDHAVARKATDSAVKQVTEQIT